MKDTNTISDQRRLGEIAAVLATGIGKFIFMDYLNWRFPFIAVSIIAWTVYVVYRSKRQKNILKHWGFRADNFGQALKIILPFGIFAVAASVVIGIFLHSINLTWHIIPILLIYPLWGVIQQFLVIALVAGNMQDLELLTIKKPLTIFLTALLFGFIHYSNNWLILGTFVLALFYAYVYLRIRNLWILGLFHGWLGGLFYYTVVNRDPFMEVFGKYLN